ncbi:MAG TPA: DUF5916 domain-containing protein [Bacteroidota bacterium]|nr:DUF5916 domain-containing protein [Bacteroidota bacterium]
MTLLLQRFLGIIVLTVFTLNTALAIDPLKPRRVSSPPVIDGRLDDPIWETAPSVTSFRTFAPDFGKVMPESTVVYTAYDEENIYFAFRCFDPDPKTIKAEITARDNYRAHDWICINLDSFNDQQALYGFYVNPLGVQGDSRFAAGSEDHSFDMVWYSAGQIDEEGYIVEVQIPLKSIRYADTNPVTMGVIFERRVSRRSEQGTYPPLDPKKGYQFLIQMLPMEFYDVKHYTVFEVLPAVTYGQKYRLQENSLLREEGRGEFGLTLKYGITSNLILDGTYNPDFSQVEADAGQVDVNLRFGLFFPEKRPFFLEGSEIFNLAATGGNQVVHTRTIVNPLIGLKLSGKLDKRSTLASIYAVDELLDAQSKPIGAKAHFPILRYKYALDDDSYFGAIGTARELSDHSNRVIGTDGFVRLDQSSYVEYQGLFSETKSSGMPALDGHSVSAGYRYGTRDLDVHVDLDKLSRNFNAEAGYVTRTGILAFSGLIRPKFYPSSSFFRRITISLSSSQTRDEPSSLWETSNSLALNVTLPGALSAGGTYSYSTEIFLGQRFKTDGFTISGGGQFLRQLNASISYRRANAIFFSSNPYQGRSSRITGSIVYQPWNQLEANASVTYVDFYRESDGEKLYEYPIMRGRLTYQFNHYLFFRAIAEYNKFRRTLLTDFLASFTYIPGTVLHAGYGSLYQRIAWENGAYVNADRFLESRRGFFFKMSYLWRL